eukprot:TRINITY_DN4430_c0_g1_i2.p1 TRINITY_DN4430_c0_g1~~TRINITY_DN4430_c0_g1_i2.p1  ORF type:complete len:257 (-),score=24.54 TRINITY_DN4430_c0_g1_i2:179-949(-)
MRRRKSMPDPTTDWLPYCPAPRASSMPCKISVRNSEPKIAACGHGCRWLRQGPGRRGVAATKHFVGVRDKGNRVILPSEPHLTRHGNNQAALRTELPVHRHIDVQRPTSHTHQMRLSSGVCEFDVVHGPEPRYLVREVRPIHREESDEDDDSQSWHSWHLVASQSSTQSRSRDGSHDSMRSMESRDSGRAMRDYLQACRANRELQDAPPNSNWVTLLPEQRPTSRTPSGERIADLQPELFQPGAWASTTSMETTSS